MKQYRNIDLAIMLAMLVTAEVVINIAARVWFPLEAYVLSPMTAIVCIVMMRWGPYAAVHAVGGGLALCIVSGADIGQYAVYCIGNCFALAALLLFKKWDKKTVRTKIPLTILFAVTAFCGVQIGRWLVGLVLGGSISDIVRLVTTDSLSLIFAVLTVGLIFLSAELVGYIRRVLMDCVITTHEAEVKEKGIGKLLPGG